MFALAVTLTLAALPPDLERAVLADWDNGVPMVVHSKTRVAFDGHGHVTVGATTRDAASSASF